MQARRITLMMLGMVTMRASSASVMARPAVVAVADVAIVVAVGPAIVLAVVPGVGVGRGARSCIGAAYDCNVPSVFTRIIAGEIPGSFVWRDDQCVAFMSINPINTGHALVVPIDEVDHWLDLPVSTAAHLMEVGHAIGRAQQAVFSPSRVGLILAGFEVPHTHLHVIPMDSMRHLDFANAAAEPDFAAIGAAARAIRGALSEQGAPGVSQ
jgi:histidine triad (HIT) family protein